MTGDYKSRRATKKTFDSRDDESKVLLYQISWSPGPGHMSVLTIPAAGFRRSLLPLVLTSCILHVHGADVKALLACVLYDTIRRDDSCKWKEGIVSSLMRRLREHPNLVAWLLLSLGMVVLVLYASKDVGFLPGQTLALVAATVALAGLCIWIINWE